MRCQDLHSQLIREFIGLDAEACKRAIADEELSSLADVVSAELRAHIEGCSDCGNAVFWLMDIRDEVDVHSFPCVHLAYACSSCAGHMMDRHLGLFSITMDRADRSGIVIGYCPWCGIELNVSATANMSQAKEST